MLKYLLHTALPVEEVGNYEICIYYFVLKDLKHFKYPILNVFFFVPFLIMFLN